MPILYNLKNISHIEGEECDFLKLLKEKFNNSFAKRFEPYFENNYENLILHLSSFLDNIFKTFFYLS
jgi:hypothetical protein